MDDHRENPLPPVGMIAYTIAREPSSLLRYSTSFALFISRSNRLSSVLDRLVSTGQDSQIEHIKTNHYDMLRVSPNANSSQIKRAYYKLSLIYHPDKNQGSIESKNKFAAVSEAYRILSNEKTRLAYDRVLLHKAIRTKSYFSEDVLRKHKKRNRRYTCDYDEWTRAHYGTTFQESRRWSNARLRSTEAIKKASHKRVVFQRLIQIVIVVFALIGGLVSNVKA